MELDFLVIGAQKAGTTSLWRYLRRHPRIAMPRSKEVPVFTAVEPDRSAWEGFVRSVFADAPANALLGKVTPDYMVGGPDADVGLVARRIRSTLPAVKLIALLRDPVDRAISGYAMAVRRGEESRPLDEALLDALDPDELDIARGGSTLARSYVVAGEYGRILSAYREYFPAEQMFVAFSSELESDPGAVIDAVLEFLDLPAGYRPSDLGIRHFAGGTRKLLEPAAEEQLRDFFDRDILPRMEGSAALNRMAFEFFLETWNVLPGSHLSACSADVRARLESHFRLDARLLTSLGVRAPWIARRPPAGS